MENTSGADFYDKDDVFNTYRKKRLMNDNPNDLMERPAFLALMDGLKGHVLDLGCGYGDIAPELIARGASRYTGIDPSIKMIALGKEQIKHPAVELFESTMEDWAFDAAHYEWVISRLALHYIEDLESLFTKIHHSLKPGGKLVFSVEHPLLTSSIHLPRPAGKKQGWIVDQYFDEGKRPQAWMGSEVMKYHRTLEGYWQLLKGAGFTIDEIKEGRPKVQLFEQTEEYERRKRIPLFLVMRARKG